MRVAAYAREVKALPSGEVTQTRPGGGACAPCSEEVQYGARSEQLRSFPLDEKLVVGLSLQLALVLPPLLPPPPPPVRSKKAPVNGMAK